MVLNSGAVVNWPRGLAALPLLQKLILIYESTIYFWAAEESQPSPLTAMRWRMAATLLP
jgi:hypothetical protein